MLKLIATCALGLEGLVEEELEELGVRSIASQRGAVAFSGRWADCWRANLALRTANRVLIELASFPAENGDALAAGAGRLITQEDLRWDGVNPHDLFQPSRTLSIRATSRRSALRDTRWIALRLKDGLVDAQRVRFGRRSSVDRKVADLPLRVFLDNDRATVLLDSSGRPLDRRGYRKSTVAAPVREQLAAACVLASGWRGGSPVADPMCGSGTLLIEAGWYAQGRLPGSLRRRWVFERWPGFDRERFEAVKTELESSATEARAGIELELYGSDLDRTALDAATQNLEVAGLAKQTTLALGDAFDQWPPAETGLLVVNPAHGERLEVDESFWPRLGDLLKQRWSGWTAVVLAGGPTRGKHIGLRPRRRIPVKNGPLEARILVFDLY